jgi:hypothetical protein
MVKSDPQTALRKYVEGVRANAQRYVENATSTGAQKLGRWFGVFFAAHQGAPYLASPETDAERIRNVQTSWNTTRAVKAQYRGRVGALAAAVPVTI